MRNTIVQTLAADSTLTVKIDPPIEDYERHFLLTPGSKNTVVVRVIDNAHVSITNPTQAFVFIIFGITRIPRISPELQATIATFIQKVRP